MKAQITLTVAESKRLIARGVAAHPAVRARLQRGMVMVSTGSTNAYVLEELLGERIDKRTYVTGRFTPVGKHLEWPAQNRPDAVFRDGQLAPDLDRFSSVRVMAPGDVFIKGANALNYERGLAGIWVGGEGGGTIGGVLGWIIARGLHLLLPVGLEKCVPYPIEAAAAAIGSAEEAIGTVTALFPVYGELFTEIEALRTLADVEAIPCGAGGIAGAEGGTALLLRGEAEAVRRALGVVETLRGEPPFYSQ
ncbi:MAG: hypothetical protein ACUVX9_16700 [Anaerolineae bacterium]